MGQSWLPDPPIGYTSTNASLHIPPVLFLNELVNEDPVVPIEVNRIDTDGYQLLDENENPDNWPSDASDEEVDQNELDAYEESEINSENRTPIDESSYFNNNEMNSENGSADRDFIIDPQQIRAAMTNITLPRSAAPPWAAEIPDGELCSFLRARISRIQDSKEEK